MIAVPKPQSTIPIPVLLVAAVVLWVIVVITVAAQTPGTAAAPAKSPDTAAAPAKAKAAPKWARKQTGVVPEFKLVVEPRAMELLQAMSVKIAAAKTVSFTATVGYEYPSKLGPPIVYTTRYDVTMQRPDKLRILMPGDRMRRLTTPGLQSALEQRRLLLRRWPRYRRPGRGSWA